MKYCPLCRAEYHPNVSVCPNCGAKLVDSLAGTDDGGNSAVLLWVGKDLMEFDLVAGALRDTQMPLHADRGLGGLVGRLLNSISTISVLRLDFDRALGVADHAIAQRVGGSGETQGCYDCGAECSAALTSCPKCRAVLFVPRQDGSLANASEANAVGKVMKYCPLCDTQYRAEYDRCTVCNIDLVPEELRGRPINEKERTEPLVLVWRGGDPVAVSQAIAALREGGIQHHVKATHDHLVFEVAMPRPKYELRVFASDAEAARQFLASIVDSPPFAIEEIEPNDEGPKHRQMQTTSAARKPAQANVAVWEGEDPAFARVLEDCLRENRIGVRREGVAPGRLRLFVTSPDADAAREIIREVREGTPLE